MVNKGFEMKWWYIAIALAAIVILPSLGTQSVVCNAEPVRAEDMANLISQWDVEGLQTQIKFIEPIPGYGGNEIWEVEFYTTQPKSSCRQMLWEDENKYWCYKMSIQELECTKQLLESLNLKGIEMYWQANAGTAGDLAFWCSSNNNLGIEVQRPTQDGIFSPEWAIPFVEKYSFEFDCAASGGFGCQPSGVT